MALVTVARYRLITGDTTTAASAASAAVEDAVGLLEDELERPLANAERTETLKLYGADAYPAATPITASGSTHDTTTIYGPTIDAASGAWWSDPPQRATVTYTGGFVERSANVGNAAALPAYMERDLAWAAHSIAHPGVGIAVPVGATSVSLGDASVSYGATGSPGRSSAGVEWSAETLRWRRRRP